MATKQEFNARTSNYHPGTPIPALVTVRPDRTFHFEIRTPPTSTLLLIAARVSPVRGRLRGAGNSSGPNKQRSAAAAAAAAAISSGAGVSRAAAAAGRAAANERAMSSGAAGAAADGSAKAGGVDGIDGEGEGATDAAALAVATASITAAVGAGKAASGGAGNSSLATVGQPVSLKHVFEIARIKQTETRLSGIPLEALARCVVAQAGSMGVVIVP